MSAGWKQSGFVAVITGNSSPLTVLLPSLLCPEGLFVCRVCEAFSPPDLNITPLTVYNLFVPSFCTQVFKGQDLFQNMCLKITWIWSSSLEDNVPSPHHLTGVVCVLWCSFYPYTAVGRHLFFFPSWRPSWDLDRGCGGMGVTCREMVGVSEPVWWRRGQKKLGRPKEQIRS